MRMGEGKKAELMSIKGVTRLSKCLLGDYGNKEAGTTISGGIIYEDTSNPNAPRSPGEEEKTSFSPISEERVNKFSYKI